MSVRSIRHQGAAMSTTTKAPVYEVGRVYEVSPGDLRIGTNVRKDTRPDAKDFAASVRARGVIVAIDAHVDEQGGLCVLRGQRRALVAAQVGTPVRHGAGAGRPGP